MRFHSSIFLGLATLLCLSACTTDESAVAGNESAEGATGTETAQEDLTISSVELGYATVEFHAVRQENGSVLTYATDERSIYVGTTPLDQLIVEKAPTGLELFLAIAPGQVPPQELVDTHESEARQHKRASAEVRALEFDHSAIVPKGTAAGCSSAIYKEPAGYYTYSSGTFDNLSGWTYYNIGGDDNYSIFDVTAGLCNESATNVATMRMTGSFVDSRVNPPFVVGTLTVNPKKAKWWYPLNRSVSCGMGCTTGARYRTSSHGDDYRTRHAEFAPIGPK